MKVFLGTLLRQYLPESLRARIPVRVRARARAVFGIEPWPDLAVRHPLFRDSLYGILREQARPFDIRKPHKPILERGHQASYLIARWFADAQVRTAFQVGYASGRYLFYLSKMGIMSGGTDLPSEETEWAEIPPDVLDERVYRRLLRVDFFKLTLSHIRRAWAASGTTVIDALFTEATFETLLPWRERGFTLQRYEAMDPQVRHVLLHERFPEKLEELRSCFRNLVFIEPEPTVAGAGAVFWGCAGRLPEFEYSVWTFRPPFDRLFRLSPSAPTRQAVYAFTQDPLLLKVLREYAEPLAQRPSRQESP